MADDPGSEEQLPGGEIMAHAVS
ncbi:hypothetical protein CCACVL1_20110 [Corchorus capsularis]|uniref:Uncharacterized protein n=1 Tax=Corchorus capsularis TaxID=210143 RepID=A0A1R3HCK1_COCAP|nr:hypothetical protein CCACVL1_20110 [Corchorus capsularis]